MPATDRKGKRWISVDGTGASATAGASSTSPDKAPPPVLLLASPFGRDGRRTVFFERPLGQDTRAAVFGAAELEESALEPCSALPPRAVIQLNANCVRHALKRAGLLVNVAQPSSRSGPILVLWARHSGDKLWKELPRHGITNHYPGSWALGRKDGLWKHLSAQQRRLGDSTYDFVPRTFVLPADRGALERAAAAGLLRGGGALIVKPLNSSRGRGVKMVLSTAELPSDPAAKLLVQEYIERPLLLQGRKFDLRLYVAVTSFDPLRAYVFEQGLARFANAPYSAAADAGARVGKELDRYAHLTNYSICKKDAGYEPNVDAAADGEGSKWSLAALWRTLGAAGHPVEAVRSSIAEVLTRTLIAAQPHITHKYSQYFRERGKCVELFGFDVLLDADLSAWLIEVNVSPDLSSSSPLDRQIKHTLAADLLHLVGVRPPVGASAADDAAAARPAPFLTRTTTGKEASELAATPLPKLGPAELDVLVECEEEEWRASHTDFRPLYPRDAATTRRCERLFATRRHADALVASHYQRGDDKRAELLRKELARRAAAHKLASRAPAPRSRTPSALARPAAVAAAAAAGPRSQSAQALATPARRAAAAAPRPAPPRDPLAPLRPPPASAWGVAARRM